MEWDHLWKLQLFKLEMTTLEESWGSTYSKKRWLKLDLGCFVM